MAPTRRPCRNAPPPVPDVRAAWISAGVTLAISACAHPISNAPFSEEATFLAALPTPATFGAPREVLLAANGPSEVLAAGKLAAARWDALVEAPLVLATAFRSREPTERTEAARRWASAEVVATYTGAVWGADEPRTAWVVAEVVALEDGSYAATLEAAATREGAPVRIGRATRDGDRATTTWDLDALAGIWDLPAPGALAAEAEVVEDGYLRTVEGTVGEGPAAEVYGIGDDDRIRFAAPLAVTDDGETWPASVEVTHRRDAGGRGEGIAYRGAEEVAFERCWDPEGRDVTCAD